MATPVDLVVRVLGSAQAAAEVRTLSGPQGLAMLARGLTAVTTAAAAAGAAVVAMTGRAIRAADEAGKLAQKLGVIVEEYTALKGAVELADVSVSDLQQAYRNLGRWMEQNGQIGRSINEVFLEQADRVAAIAPGAERAAFATKIFGESAQNLMPLLSQGSEGIQRQMDLMKELGLVLGPEGTRQAAQFNQSIKTLMMAFKGLFMQFSQRLLPTLNKYLDWLVDSMIEGEYHKKALDLLVLAYQYLAREVAQLVWMFQSITTIAGSFVGTLWATMDPAEALQQTVADLNVEWQKYQERLESIQRLSLRPPEDVTPPVEMPTSRITGEADTIDERIRELELWLANLRVAETQAAALRPVERQRALLDVYQTEATVLTAKIALLDEEIQRQEELLALGEDGADRALHAARMAQMDVLRARVELDQLIVQAEQSLTLGGALDQRWDQLYAGVSDTAGDLANVLMSPIEGFRDGLSQSLDDLILKGSSAGEFFGTLAAGIGTSMRRAFVDMVTNWVTSHVLMKGVSLAWKGFLSLMRKADVVEANATEAAKMPALAGTATLASIGSWGIAVAIGLAAITAVLAGIGAFADGGVVHGPGGPRDDRVLARLSNGEGVVNAAAMANVGESFLNSLNAGVVDLASLPAGASVRGGGAAAPGKPMGGATVNTAIHMAGVYDSKSAALRALDSPEGRAFLIDFMKSSVHEVGV